MKKDNDEEEKIIQIVLYDVPEIFKIDINVLNILYLLHYID
jgi:hypothetical protein